MYALIHVQAFFYEDILDMKWLLVIHCDPRLRHAFDDALVDTVSDIWLRLMDNWYGLLVVIDVNH